MPVLCEAATAGPLGKRYGPVPEHHLVRMSAFVRDINAYGDRYGVRAIDRARLLAHYPLFKLAWLALSRTGRWARLAELTLRPFRHYEIRHRIQGVSGEHTLAMPFELFGLESFAEVFLHNEYDFPWRRGDIHTFVDLGANVGMASLYLLMRYPVRFGVTVEANPSLIGALRRRLDPFKSHVAIVNAAVVGRETPTGVPFAVAPNHRLSSVTASEQGRAPITVGAVTLSQVLDQYNMRHADLLKMDVEGAEFDVMQFDSGALQRFRYLAVEVHGKRTERAGFLTSLADLGFQMERGSETADSVTVLAERGS